MDDSTFKILILKCMIFLLSFTVGIEGGHRTVDLVEDIRKHIGNDEHR